MKAMESSQPLRAKMWWLTAPPLIATPMLMGLHTLQNPHLDLLPLSPKPLLKLLLKVRWRKDGVPLRPNKDGDHEHLLLPSPAVLGLIFFPRNQGPNLTLSWFPLISALMKDGNLLTAMKRTSRRWIHIGDFLWLDT
ncbi:hypothetical protein QJS04_geneDACA014813 [Acorus gramineus]|uniref:Uncharacterized protein n=1 Tax=Acorus gramineus TaxID=55184 RepID=A0AAV9BQC1_ACOGR|nr:hypothetical protein QJS04_geneDACA014813 [Acorus gramineus]